MIGQKVGMVLLAGVAALCLYGNRMDNGQRGKPLELTTSQAGPRLLSEMDVVGSYYQGDGKGFNLNLKLDEDRTFTFKSTGCLGDYGAGSGTWSIEGDKLKLKPAFGIEPGAIRDLDLVYVPIVFDGHIYLPDEFQAPAFLTNITDQSGWVSRTAHLISAYVKIGKSFKSEKVDLADQIPARYKPFVDREVECRVKELRGDGLVLIDAGSDAGLFPGIRLRAKEDSPVELAVLSVKKSSCLARAEIVFDEPGKLEEGDAFHTGISFDRPLGTGNPRYTFKW